jgi:hypothetical protein
MGLTRVQQVLAREAQPRAPRAVLAETEVAGAPGGQGPACGAWSGARQSVHGEGVRRRRCGRSSTGEGRLPVEACCVAVCQSCAPGPGGTWALSGERPRRYARGRNVAQQGSDRGLPAGQEARPAAHLLKGLLAEAVRGRALSLRIERRAQRRVWDMCPEWAKCDSRKHRGLLIRSSGISMNQQLPAPRVVGGGSVARARKRGETGAGGLAHDERFAGEPFSQRTPAPRDARTKH